MYPNCSRMRVMMRYFTVRKLVLKRIILPFGTMIVLLKYLITDTTEHLVNTEKGDLPLLYRDEVPIVNGNNLFMLETLNQSTLSPRVLCSLESYIKMNPSATFWFVVNTKRLDAMTTNYLNSIRGTYEIELRIVTMDAKDVVRDTPLRQLLDAPGFWKSKNLIENLSDLCRLAIVFKSGGFYSNTDIVNYNSILHLKNFLVRQTTSFVANGFFHFEAGHPFLLEIMNYISQNFDEKKLGSSGTLAVTGSLKRYCISTPLTPVDSIHYYNYMKEGICERKKNDGFKAPVVLFSCNKLSIFPDVAMYPINTSKFTVLFNETAEEICLSQLMQVSYGIHLSNRLSAKTSAKTDSAINQLATSFCPTIFFKNSGKVY